MLIADCRIAEPPLTAFKPSPRLANESDLSQPPNTPPRPTLLQHVRSFQSNLAALRWSPMVPLSHRPPAKHSRQLTTPQENPLAPLRASKGAATQTPASRRRRHIDGRQRAREAGRYAESGREVEGGDAEGGGDAAEGQVHDFRSEGEEVSEGGS